MRERFGHGRMLRPGEVRHRNPCQTRHTCASMLRTAGEDPRWIAGQMGYEDGVRLDWGRLIRCPMSTHLPRAGLSPFGHHWIKRTGRRSIGLEMAISWMVRKGRLELPRLAALEPKSSASTNSATLAFTLS
uniref:Prophage integrase-like protein n=1 Tax=Acidithiobacillus caldus TaxID=33059 RepID=Q0PL57_9PROT|nr:prophage integrase-like protein [Acidithiobacillus caldus]